MYLEYVGEVIFVGEELRRGRMKTLKIVLRRKRREEKREN